MASPGKKSFPLRIDPVLWQAIERLASQEIRSANAQVEYLLREALAQRGIRIKTGTDVGDATAGDSPGGIQGGSASV